MIPSFNTTRALFFATLVAALIAAGIALKAQRENAAGLERASMEGLFWSAAQVEIELSRLTAKLGQYVIDRSSVTPEEVNERFDILWSRILLFQQGDVGHRLAALDTKDVVPTLFKEVQRHEPQIVDLAEQSDRTIADIIGDLTAFNEGLRGLSIRVIRAEEERLATVRSNVRASSELTLVTMGTVLLTAVLIVGLLLFETRRFKQAAEASQALAERAEAAARVKSRFLTMMSHELRTPMNGVMGMLALARQTQLTDAQGRLIEQAQRSGARMVALLGDMLDLSDLQSERQSLSREAFPLADLAEEVRHDLAPRTERGVLEARVEIAESAPGRVSGDLPRLRQSVRHLLTHIIEIVGSPSVGVLIGHDGMELTVEIEAALPGGDGGWWKPEAILGTEDGSYDHFASEALSPMIARGLLDLMQGRIEVARSDAGGAVVTVRVPFPAIEDRPRAVRVEVESQTQAAVLLALLRAEGLQLWSAASGAGAAGAVLVSAGDRDEVDLVSGLRRMHRRARIVAIGAPEQPALFDAVCPVPVTRAALVAAVSGERQLARHAIL